MVYALWTLPLGRYYFSDIAPTRCLLEFDQLLRNVFYVVIYPFLCQTLSSRKVFPESLHGLTPRCAASYILKRELKRRKDSGTLFSSANIAQQGRNAVIDWCLPWFELSKTDPNRHFTFTFLCHSQIDLYHHSLSLKINTVATALHKVLIE